MATVDQLAMPIYKPFTLLVELLQMNGDSVRLDDIFIPSLR